MNPYKDPYSPEAIASQRKRYKKYYEKNKEKLLATKRKYKKIHKIELNQWQSIYRFKLKEEAMNVYDSKCQECGWNDILVLQWHHNNGQKKREETKTIQLRIRKNQIRENTLELLCNLLYNMYFIAEEINE